jgi:hypothetical protein
VAPNLAFMGDDPRVLRPENRWLAALTLLWLVVPLWLLRLGSDVTDLLDEPPTLTLRVLSLVLVAGTLVLTLLHARANAVRRPVARSALTTLLMTSAGWVAWVWTVDGHRGSGPVLALPLCLLALVCGALVGSRPSPAA